MIGSENQEDAHLDSSREEMESLVLNDYEDERSINLASKSYLNYRSAMTTLSSSFASTAASHHPLSPMTTPATSDPLLSPPSPQTIRSPNSTNNNKNNSYPEPPSYANVILSPLDDPINSFEANGADSPSKESENSTFFSRSHSSTDYLDIKVSNPQKEVEASSSIVPGNNTYVTYFITTTTNISDYGGSEFSVRRRFKDVVTLSDRLTEAYRGFFIPPRPDKSIMESQVMQKLEFVEQRRVALEKYLRRLAEHPVIKKSDELRVFLQVQGKMPLPTSVDVASRMLDGAVKLPKQLLGDSGTVMEPQDVVQPAKGGRDLLRLFKELKQSVAIDWGGSRPPVEEEDKEFLERKEKLHDLEQHLTNASKQAALLVKARQDLGETMGELGLAFVKLTKFENEEAVLNTQRVRATDMKNVATAAVKASRFHRGLNAQTMKHLDTLHEYMGLMLAVQCAFSDRSSALLTVQTLLSELSSLHLKGEKLESASSKIFGGDKSRTRKTEELKDAIRVTEDAKSCAIREYERIKRSYVLTLVGVIGRLEKKYDYWAVSLRISVVELYTNAIPLSVSGGYLSVSRIANKTSLITLNARLSELLVDRVWKENFLAMMYHLVLGQKLEQNEGNDENNRSEIQRFDRERQTDFVNMLKGFVINQVAYMEKIENQWAQVAEETCKYANERP